MFRVGDFSKLSRVSVKMLRHYDELGLIKPAWVDPVTDYRYYTAAQLPQLNRVLALKDLGFSLEQIAGVLAEDPSPERFRELLRIKRTEVDLELRRQQARLAAVNARLRQLEAGPPPAHEVVLRSLPPLAAATLRKVIPTADDMEQLFEDVERHVAGHGARAAAAPLALYHDPEYREQEVDVEVAIPVTRPVPDQGPITCRELPAVPAAACVVHVGSYTTIEQASSALYLWIEANGYRSGGPSREVYLRFGAAGLEVPLPAAYLAPSADAFVTELQVPVAKT
jgi:DNA-binding transcriptional MerR regulator